MRYRKPFFAIMVLLICVTVGAAILVLRQRSLYLTDSVTLWETYTAPDSSFSFRYPAGWYVETPGEGQIVLENVAYEQRFESPDAIRLDILPPTSVSQLNMLGQGATPIEFVQQAANAGNLAAVLFSSAPLQGQEASTGWPTVPPDNWPVVTFNVDGRPAAWVRQSYNFTGIDITSMTICVDVGHDTLVAILVSSYASGSTTLLDRYQDTILNIADSLRYTPPATPPGSNVNLPQTFTGAVGGWGMGEITFNYPADWYAVGFVTAFIQNTPTKLNQHALQPGQMQAAVVDPASNMALIRDWKEVVDCRANPEGVTAWEVVQKQLPTTAAQKDQASQAGITYSEPENIQINGKDAVLLRIHQAQEDVLLVDIDLGNGNIAGLMAFAPEGEMSRYESTLLAVVGTFSYTPKAGCNPPTARPPAVQTEIANQITPSPLPTAFYATAVPGEKIALVSADQTDGWQIFLMDTNGENRQQLTHQQGLYSSLAWSPDAKHLAFILFPSDFFAGLSAYVIKTDGSEVQLLADNVESTLVWSPDGQKIAFISRKTGRKQIYTVSADGSNLRVITTGERDIYGLTWAPNGQQLVFYRDDYNIYVINADGTGEHPLTDSRNDELPTWSPDGSLIAFSSGRADNQNLNELFIMNVDGSEIRQLTDRLAIPTASTATADPEQDWYSIQNIVWSPNGQHLAFLVKKMGVVDAFVIDPDGTHLHHIASELFGGLSWSPDSQHVTYSAGAMGAVQTFVANADGSGRYALVNSTPMDGSPSWSPLAR